MVDRAVIIVLTSSALPLARRIKDSLALAEIHGRSQRIGTDEVDTVFEEATRHIAALFRQGKSVIGVCAAGILIRAAAPYLQHKYSDPPLVAVSEDGEYVVPLLGGHHGANDLARNIADTLGASAAITTASDVKLGVSLDEPPSGWILANPENTKAVVAKLVAGEPVRVDPALDWLNTASVERNEHAELALCEISPGFSDYANGLGYYARRYVIGVGAERGADPDELIALVEKNLKHAKIANEAISCITSIDVKADEAAIILLATHLAVPARFFTAARLAEEAPRLKNPSNIVLQEVGCPGVAEGAAFAGAGEHAELVIEKTKSKRTTMAVARARKVIDPADVGRARGSLSIVGIGPGQPAWRTGECVDQLVNATDWVGYNLYLDLIDDLREGQLCHKFELGAEIDRVRVALDLAGEGRRVALVCSGDAGIYAMAALVYELLDAESPHQPITDGAYGVALTVVPGVSAFQAAGARAGAPIGHDFCCISLSDLLTPWPVIESRIKAAAEGDFVTAFYNPKSLRRTVQIETALQIISEHRPANTPVIIASNLGRREEKVEVVPLENVEVEKIDMLTLVMIGASNSRTIQTGDGRQWTFTPRGYERKTEI